MVAGCAGDALPARSPDAYPSGARQTHLVGGVTLSEASRPRTAIAAVDAPAKTVTSWLLDYLESKTKAPYTRPDGGETIVLSPRVHKSHHESATIISLDSGTGCGGWTARPRSKDEIARIVSDSTWATDMQEMGFDPTDAACAPSLSQTPDPPRKTLISSDFSSKTYLQPMKIAIVELGTNRCSIEAVCPEPDFEPIFDEMLREVGTRWPESGLAQTEPKPEPTVGTGETPKNAGRGLGRHGGTMSRVEEAWALVQQGVPRTTACKRAGIDPRTYDRYVMDITCPDNEE